jgi:hypothetical protein
MYELSMLHREPGMPGYDQASEYARQTLAEMPLDGLSTVQFTCDGKARYTDTWVSVPYWEPRKGVLELLEPERRILADFTALPSSLGLRSSSTPPDGVTSELIYVGDGVTDKDYESVDVRGKIVLADPDGQLGIVAVREARKHGASGVVLASIISSPPAIPREDRLDLVGHCWLAFWWNGVEWDWSPAFSFSISPRVAQELLGYMKSGRRVVVRACVDADLRAGTMDLVQAVLTGSDLPQEEVAVLAHLDHPWPGSDDNAAGSALLMELAETFSTMVREGVLPRPRRTIRFMWVPHLIGTIGYIERNPGWLKDLHLAVSCDMVGGDPDKTKGIMGLDPCPLSTPSYATALAEHFMERLKLRSPLVRIPRWDYRVAPNYQGGTEHMAFVEGLTGVPGLAFGRTGSWFYHTTEDSPDKVNPKELHRSGWVVGLLLWAVANADRNTGLDIARITATWAVREMARYMERQLTILGGLDKSDERGGLYEETRWALRFAADRYRECVRSTLKLGPLDLERLDKLSSRITSDEAFWLEELENHASNVVATAEDDDPRGRAVPRRLYKGPFNIRHAVEMLEERVGQGRCEWLVSLAKSLPTPVLSRTGLTACLRWADGARNIDEILRAVRWERGSAPSVDVFYRFLSIMQEAGFVSIRE